MRRSSSAIYATKPRDTSTRAYTLKSGAVAHLLSFRKKQERIQNSTSPTNQRRNRASALDTSRAPILCIALQQSQGPVLNHISPVYTSTSSARLSTEVSSLSPGAPPPRTPGSANHRRTIVTQHVDPVQSTGTAKENGSALSRFRELLRPDHLTTTVFSKPVIDELIDLYRSCFSRQSSARLSGKELEALIAIVGAYTSSSPVPQLLSRDIRTVKTPGSDEARYWDFLLGLVKVKARVTETSLEDRYWRARALLRGLRDGTQPSRGMLAQLIEDYEATRGHVPDHAFHFSFFRAVLVFGTKGQLARVSSYLCDRLEGMKHPSLWWSDLFWKFLLALEQGLLPGLQTRFLAIVHSRLFDSTDPGCSLSDQRKQDLPSKEILLLAGVGKVFASCVFSSYMPPHISTVIRDWAFKETREAFTDERPLSQRWANLLLLSRAMVAPTDGRWSSHTPLPHETTSYGTWQIILTLLTLDVTLKKAGLLETLDPPTRAHIQDGSFLIWKNWARMDGRAVPPAVECAVVAIFFNIAAFTGHTAMLGNCAHYCETNALWNSDKVCRSQQIQLVASYVNAIGKWRYHYAWDKLLDHVSRLVPDAISKRELISFILPLLVPHDIHQAISLFEFASTKRIQIQSEALHSFGIALADAQKWSIVLPLLESAKFTPHQIESILVTIFRRFQVSRLEVVNAKLAESLGWFVLDTYTNIGPSPGSKYPVRYFLQLLIAAGHGALAVDVMQKIFEWDPALFSQRCTRRYIVQLVERQRQGDAVRLFKIAYPHYTLPQAEDFRRKLLAALVDSGASQYAREVAAYCAPAPNEYKRSTAEQMLRVLLDRRPPGPRIPVAGAPARGGQGAAAAASMVRPSEAPKTSARTPSQRKRRQHTRATSGATRRLDLEPIRILAILHADADPSATAMRTAISILARHGRTLEARKVFAQYGGKLDREGRAALGNIIMHGLLQTMRRGGKTLERMVEMCDAMRAECGFQPDRTTVNILMKGVLAGYRREESAAASRGEPSDFEPLRRVFGLAVEGGYLPHVQEWFEAGACGAMDGALSLPSLETQWVDKMPVVDQPMDYRRHVEPLYRMFIKHFQLRGDREAAYRVIGLLKAGDEADLERREGQSRERRMGVERMKARKKGRRRGEEGER